MYTRRRRSIQTLRLRVCIATAPHAPSIRSSYNKPDSAVGDEYLMLPVKMAYRFLEILL